MKSHPRFLGWFFCWTALYDKGIIGKKKERKDHAIHFRPLCLVVYPTYFVSIERAVVRTGILLYDPRGQNDPRNRALDDQLDRLRVD